MFERFTYLSDSSHTNYKHTKDKHKSFFLNLHRFKYTFTTHKYYGDTLKYKMRSILERNYLNLKYITYYNFSNTGYKELGFEWLIANKQFN